MRVGPGIQSGERKNVIVFTPGSTADQDVGHAPSLGSVFPIYKMGVIILTYLTGLL